MKKRCTILSLLAVVLLVVCLCGCPSPGAPAATTPSTSSGGNSGDSSGGGNSSGSSGGGTTPPATVDVSFTLKSMPYDAVGLKAGVQLYDNRYDELEFVELGTIEQLDQQAFTGAVNAKTSMFKAFLYNETIADKKYESDGTISFSKGTAAYEVSKLWKISGKEDGLAPCYGLNASYVEVKDLTELTTLQFTEKKFYIYKFENVRDQVMKIEYNTSNTDIFITSDLSNILSRTDLTKVNTTTYSSYQPIAYRTDAWQADTLYMLLELNDYEKIDNSQIQISVVNWTQLSKACINCSSIHYSELLSDSEILFTGENERYDFYKKPERKNLYSFSFETNTVTLLKECDNEISFIVPYDNGFFFSTGREVWYLDKADRSMTKKKTMNGEIAGMCFIKDDLMVMYKKGSGSNTAVPMLLYPDTFKQDTTKKAGDFTCDTMVSLVYNETNDRLFYYSTGNHLGYIWWDTLKTKPDFNKLERVYNNDPKKGPPVKQFGTTNYLAAGTGHLFHMDGQPSSTVLGSTKTIKEDDILLSGIADAVGTSFIDIEFTDDYYYTLTNTDEGYIVRKFDMRNFDPEAEHTPEKEYSVSGQKGTELVLRSDDILVTSVAKTPVYSGYYPVSVIKLDYNLTSAD